MFATRRITSDAPTIVLQSPNQPKHHVINQYLKPPFMIRYF